MPSDQIRDSTLSAHRTRLGIDCLVFLTLGLWGSAIDVGHCIASPHRFIVSIVFALPGNTMLHYSYSFQPPDTVTSTNIMPKKRVLVGYGVDLDAVAGWLGSYGGEDSVNDISRGKQHSPIVKNIDESGG